MGDTKAEAFSQGLSLTEARKIKMESNSISPRGGNLIIASLSPLIQELNLENNFIGRGEAFVDALVKQFLDPKFQLQSLNISRNEINDA